MADHLAISQVGLVAMSLLNIKGIGSKTVWKNLAGTVDRVEHDAEAWFYDVSARLKKGDNEASHAWDTTRRQVEDCESFGIKPLCVFDPDYPVRLREIPDPPAMLYTKGVVSALHSGASIAIVGTLEPTDFGFKSARRLGKVSAEAGVCVVSGLARGCDTAAHLGCLDANGVGVAVLAHGLDMVYPPDNQSLADELVVEGGCLVSEYPVGIKPFPKSFAVRDRIQSGLSAGVLVVETPIEDGTMHTVNFAKKQRRALGCVQHPDHLGDDPQIQGNRRILRDGAHPVTDHNEFQSFLEYIANPDRAPAEGQLGLEALR